MLAWIELIRFNRNDPDAVVETLTEMENDVGRLNMIAVRFSKIGSMPVLAPCLINSEIENVASYNVADCYIMFFSD